MIVKPSTTPPITAEYLVIDQPASFTKISMTIGLVKTYNSDKRQTTMRSKDERKEKPLVIL